MLTATSTLPRLHAADRATRGRGRRRYSGKQLARRRAWGETWGAIARDVSKQLRELSGR